MRIGIKNALRRFLSNASGSITPMLAGGAVALVASVGIATDAARGYMVKARLAQALDSAALAGGKVIFSPTRDQDIAMFFQANFPTDFMGATITGPTIDVSQDYETLTLSASAQIDTTFMRVLGFSTLDVSSTTEVTRRSQLTDVVMAIDMSGSMSSYAGGGKSRIQAARGAAKKLVSILFGDDPVKDYLHIGVVPWNERVTVAVNGQEGSFDPSLTTTVPTASFTNPLTGLVQNEVYVANNSPVPFLSPPEAVWEGCVYSRYIDNADSDDDADIVETVLSGSFGDWVAWEPVGYKGLPVPGWSECDYEVPGSNAECLHCLGHGVTPLTNVRATIDAAIDQLQNPEGATNITAGLSWAWRVLTPEAPFTEADPNPPGNRHQALILLTDGENYGWSGDGYKGVWGLGSAARNEMNDRLRTLATNIKAAGVTIYTIQFAYSSGPLAQLMKDVASSPDPPFYNYAPDADALEQVFKEVANHLSELRLSK